MAEQAAPEPPTTDPHTIVKSWLERQFEARKIAIHGLLQGHVRHECQLDKARIVSDGDAYLDDVVRFPVRAHPRYDAVVVRHSETATHITLRMTFE